MTSGGLTGSCLRGVLLLALLMLEVEVTFARNTGCLAAGLAKCPPLSVHVPEPDQLGPGYVRANSLHHGSRRLADRWGLFAA